MDCQARLAKAALKKQTFVPSSAGKLLRNKLGLTLLILVVIIGLAFFGRGWIRKTAEPKVVAVTSGSSVRKTAEQQLNILGNPLEQMGYKNISKSSVCFMATARSIHTEVTCNYVLSAYSKISDLKNSYQLNSKAATIETALKNNGWEGIYGLGASPYTSLTRLSKSLSSGIDYQPDAAYIKSIGKITCIFDSNTAYSHPAPAAISSRYVCSKAFEVFGSP